MARPPAARRTLERKIMMDHPSAGKPGLPCCPDWAVSLGSQAPDWLKVNLASLPTCCQEQGSRLWRDPGSRPRSTLPGPDLHSRPRSTLPGPDLHSRPISPLQAHISTSDPYLHSRPRSLPLGRDLHPRTPSLDSLPGLTNTRHADDHERHGAAGADRRLRPSSVQQHTGCCEGLTQFTC